MMNTFESRETSVIGMFSCNFAQNVTKEEFIPLTVLIFFFVFCIMNFMIFSVAFCGIR